MQVKLGDWHRDEVKLLSDKLLPPDPPVTSLELWGRCGNFHLWEVSGVTVGRVGRVLWGGIRCVLYVVGAECALWGARVLLEVKDLYCG